MVVSTSNSSIVLVAADAAATKNDGAKAMEPQSQTRGQVQMIMHERRMLLWNQSMKDDQFAASQSDDDAGNHGPHLLGDFHGRLLEIVFFHMQSEGCVFLM